MDHKRITVFVGHYGSGKTNIAINYAKTLKNAGHDVVIADLDIVNPYFRTKDSELELRENGIELICSVYANTNIDIPALPSDLYSVTENRNKYAVLDIGGDDRGALALGRLTPYIIDEDNYEMLLVVNFSRPLTRTVNDVIEVISEIEHASGLKVTALVNNTNLGEDTDVNLIKSSHVKIKELSSITGLPIKFTSVNKNISSNDLGIDNILYMNLQKRIF